MPEITDLELVQDFQKGNKKTFDELVRRYQQKVYWIARRMVGNHNDADDVVQDVFLKVYNNLENFRSDSSFYTWIYRITTNLAINLIRKRKILDLVRFDDVFPTLTDKSDENFNPSKKFEIKENKSLLDEAIMNLSPKQKKVFVFRYFEEMPYEEISKILKTSIGGLKANYFHAIKNIQKYVKRKSEF